MSWAVFLGIRHHINLLGTLLGIAICAGCATQPKYGDATNLYATGNYTESIAALETDGRTDRDDEKLLLVDLACGAAYHAAGQVESALNAYETAEETMAKQQEAFASGLTGAYVGEDYDAIMLNTYKGLLRCEQGNTDGANIEFKRAKDRQEEATSAYERRKEQAEEELARARTDVTKKAAMAIVDSVMDCSEMKEACDGLLERMEHWSDYPAFVNPFAWYMEGILRLFSGDYDEGSRAFEYVRNIEVTKPVRLNCALADRLADGKVSPKVLPHLVWIIFENGLGPDKTEFRFDTIIPINDAPVHLGIALPELVERSEAYPSLILRDESGVELGRTETICNMDQVVATEFRKDFPLLLSKEVASTVLHVVLQALATQAAKAQWGEKAGMLAGMAGSALSEATTSADTRIWTCLPKNIQGALVRHPPNGILRFCVPGGMAPIGEVQLTQPGPTLVYVKVPAPGVPPICRVLIPHEGD